MMSFWLSLSVSVYIYIKVNDLAMYVVDYHTYLHVKACVFLEPDPYSEQKTNTLGFICDL